MEPVCILAETLDLENHHFRVFIPNEQIDWLVELASRYVQLRTESLVPISDITMDGVTILSNDIERYLRDAVVPSFHSSPGHSFDVLRSDMGEMLAYRLLEEHYSAKIGYKSIRDRELINLPGRGIDAVGVIDGDPLLLVLSEAKVSDETSSPPQVVDRSGEGLRNQHQDHLQDMKGTCRKVWDIVRRSPKGDAREILLKAAILLQFRRWDMLQIIANCVLIRPSGKYLDTDFGSFRNDPSDFDPAIIWFLIVSIPIELRDLIDYWYEAIEQEKNR